MDDKKILNHITLEDTEIKVNSAIYDQDIGQEYKIEVDEIKYEDATDISEVKEKFVPEEEIMDFDIDEFKKSLSIQREIKETETKEEIPEESKEEDTGKEEPSEGVEKVAEEVTSENVEETKETVEEPEEEAKDEVSEEPKEENNEKPSEGVEKVNEEVTENVEETKEAVEEPDEEAKDEVSEKPKEETKEEVKSRKDDSYKSDKKIIRIAGIIALLLLIVVVILFMTRKKVEKAYPVIKLIGDETIVLDVGSEYKELGYFALDQEDGDITKRVSTIGEVDTSKPGVYKIKYKVLDIDRMKTEVYRNVIVRSTKNNFDFTINGNDVVFISSNADYVEEGYKAIYQERDISTEVKVFGRINRSIPGNYTLTYVLEKDNQVATLKRTIVVFKGEEMDSGAELITELNNWLIDEIHYSNKVSLDNISTSALLYFGILNCRDGNTEVRAKDMNECLKKITNKEVKIPLTTKYNGVVADISYNSSKQSWIINRLDLPRPKEDLFKIVVDNDTIYLYESYGYGVALNNREICDGNDNKVYYSGVDRNYLLGYESCKLSNGEKEVTKNYKLALYVHTFKVKNGKYYWTSSEMVK